MVRSFSNSRSKINQKFSNKSSSLRKKRDRRGLFTANDVGKKVPIEFISWVNTLVGLKWHALNVPNILNCVGTGYRSATYKTISSTRRELKDKYGIGYRSSLVGTEDYKPYDYAALQALGLKRVKYQNPLKNSKNLDKDKFIFTIGKTSINGSKDSEYQVRTNIEVDNYIYMNSIRGSNITYRPGSQGESGVLVWNQVFVENVFPYHISNSKTFYLYRIQTSARSQHYIEVEKLKALGIYKENKYIFNNFYEKDENGLPLYGSSFLTSYAYVPVKGKTVVKKVLDSYLGSNFDKIFKESVEKSLDKKIKNVLLGESIKYEKSKKKK